MIETRVPSKYDNKKLDRFISSQYPEISRNDFFKLLRKKDIKINGVRVSLNTEVKTGDLVQIYYSTEKSRNLFTYNTVYSDDNIIVIDKPQGLPVQPDKHVEVSLIELAQKEYGTSVSLCHRLDRNTGGLIILGRNPKITNLVMEKIQTNEIQKKYVCLCYGKMPLKQDMLTAWLDKDVRNSTVYIHDSPAENLVEIKTAYKVVEYHQEDNYSKLEISLFTGRTHQIRAHLAHIGHPLLGDGKYGNNSLKLPLPLKYQALYAYKIEFKFKNLDHELRYLDGTHLNIEYKFF
ncbi:MAG: RluA family pseudouridine synthase [Oscillospiraceae bacterium]|jgi:23S rRNA pseudouridine955/2504/2580 synthase|nr:RluA family pseudouridine synthase [Oscillospiraceae bacterium]